MFRSVKHIWKFYTLRGKNSSLIIYAKNKLLNHAEQIGNAEN